MVLAETRHDAPAPTTSPLYWDWDIERDFMTWSGDLAAVVDGPTDEAATRRVWWEARIHPDDLAAVRAGLDRLARGAEQHWRGAYRIRGRDGRDIPVVDRAVVVERDGRPHRIIGVIERTDIVTASAASDIHERLRQSERRFERFVDSLPLLAWEADASGWLVFYNERWFQYTGTTPAEMEGWGWTRVHDPLDLPRMLRVWRRALQTGEAWEDAFRLRRGSDGMLRWHLSRATPLKDESGRVIRWFGTNTDIHDQRLALEERDRLLKDAQAASRAKDEFLALVSHELRTPLGVILNWSQILRRGIDPQRLAQGLERLERNARMLGRLIEDLLDVSRIVSEKFTLERRPIDLHAPVQQALDALRGDAERRQIRIELDLCPTCSPVLACPQRVQQIVTNLVGNAIKFSEPGGRIQVTLLEEGDAVTIRVRDFGAGIDPALLPVIFGRFQQADSSSTRRHGGLGLGLYIARHLVEAHGGTITVESEGPGRGATFTARFPSLSGGPLPDSPGEAPSDVPVSLVGRKVLVVDDDPESREVVGVLLTRCGATVALAGSVAEALEQLRADVPDIIVSDLAMPEVDGYGLLERLRTSPDARWRNVRVLALTAHASAQDRAAALRAGFDVYLSKPFDTAALSRTIAECAGLGPRDPKARPTPAP